MDEESFIMTMLKMFAVNNVHELNPNKRTKQPLHPSTTSYVRKFHSCIQELTLVLQCKGSGRIHGN